MPRLIDDLRAGGKLSMPFFVLPRHEEAWGKLAGTLHQALCDPSLPVLLIDNVSDYYFTGTDQEYWDLTRDFPNLAPPFPVCWFENKLARSIHSKDCGDTDLTKWIPHGRQGVLLHGLTRDQWQGEGIPDNAQWILWCELFIDYNRRGTPCAGPHGSMFLAVDGEGAIIGTPWMQTFAGPEHEGVIEALITFLHPALLAISFLHCKNVHLAEHVVERPLARKYRERHGIAPANYKTLVIEPLKQILRSEGRAGEVGLAKAMHICRGHFRDYREGRGLFGKYHQLVWTPSIIRGTRGGGPPPREIEVKLV